MNAVVNIKKPTSNGTKGDPIQAAPVVPNTAKAPSTGTVQLAVQVPADVRRAFKAYAAERDLDMSKLFRSMWDEYRRNNP